MFASSFNSSSSKGRGRGRGIRVQTLEPEEAAGSEVQPTSLRKSIRDLSPHQPNTEIIGIVVAKQNFHSFPDKRNPGQERFKCSFTIRDSPSDFINVTCWGSEEFITKIHRSFKISDVVKVNNCQILSKAGGEYEDRWQPWTPSQYQLNMSETHSSLSLYTGWDYTQFSSLAHIPLRPHNDYYTLSDILSNGHSLDGAHINILAVIRHVGVPKQMNSRSGKAIKKCDVKLMDGGCTSFMMFLWDCVLINLAQTWIPKQNIIFVVDAKVTFDTYRNCMVATCDQKSIITTNPDIPEAHQLYTYAQSVDLSSECDLQGISQFYSVEGLKQHQEQLCGESDLTETQSTAGGRNQFVGILFAFLTSLEIDQNVKNVICHRCTSCRFRVDNEATQCSNQGCLSHDSSSSNTPGGGFTTEPHFNLIVSFSDHTGALCGVRLSGKPANDIFGCTPQEFLMMSGQKKVELKHTLLLERFKVYFKSTNNQLKPSVQILTMNHTTPEEVAKHVNIL